jgi:Omp85 superfamily domain
MRPPCQACRPRCRRLAVLLAVAAVLAAAPLAAQTGDATSRADEYERQQQEKAQKTHPYTPSFMERQILEIEESGGFTAVRGVSVAFGGIKESSGIALGPMAGHTFANGSFVQGKAEYSIRSFKLLQGMYQAPPIAGGKLIVNGRARWQDAPRVPVFRIGQDSPPRRAEYAEERTEFSAQALAHPISFVRLAGGSGYEKYITNGGGVPLSEDERLDLVPPVPGLNADPQYIHSYAQAALDWRESPGYSRSGFVLEGVMHDYRARNNAPYSFRQADGLAQGLVPIIHGDIVLDLAARVWTTSTTGGDIVPFFLLPKLGGAQFLRGYRSYRFRDRNAYLLTGQYRWYVQEYVEGVLFYEAGQVAPSTNDFTLRGLKRSYGFGVHFHTPAATVLRLEIARSVEGTRYIFGFGLSGL